MVSFSKPKNQTVWGCVLFLRAAVFIFRTYNFDHVWAEGKKGGKIHNNVPTCLILASKSHSSTNGRIASLKTINEFKCRNYNCIERRHSSTDRLNFPEKKEEKKRILLGIFPPLTHPHAPLLATCLGTWTNTEPGLQSVWGCFKEPQLNKKEAQFIATTQTLSTHTPPSLLCHLDLCFSPFALCNSIWIMYLFFICIYCFHFSPDTFAYFLYVNEPNSLQKKKKI